MIYFTNETGSCKTTVQFWQKVHGVDITHDNVCSSMLSCFYSHLLSTGRPISSLFSSPPLPQPLGFEALSLTTPRNVPPTPGTALQNKIENRLEKSLGNTFNIQLKQEMGLFQASEIS